LKVAIVFQNGKCSREYFSDLILFLFLLLIALEKAYVSVSLCVFLLLLLLLLCWFCCPLSLSLCVSRVLWFFLVVGTRAFRCALFCFTLCLPTFGTQLQEVIFDIGVDDPDQEVQILESYRCRLSVICSHRFLSFLCSASTPPRIQSPTPPTLLV
jgi:hypothetical protein